MHFLSELFGFTWYLWRFQILDQFFCRYVGLIKLLASLQAFAHVFGVKAHQRILLELVTLIYFASTELWTLSNRPMDSLIFFGVNGYLYPSFSKTGGFTNLGVDFWSLSLVLRYFALVVNRRTDIEHRLRRIDLGAVVVAVLLLEEAHLFLSSLLLDLVSIFYVYHFFLEFFQKLIYSWLIDSWIISVCSIILSLLN